MIFIEVPIRQINSEWLKLEGEKPGFGGAQAILVNSGDWRLQLKSKAFRCDMELCRALKDIGIDEIYHTKKILIGTVDPITTVGRESVVFPVLTDARWWARQSDGKFGFRDIKESEIIVDGDYRPGYYIGDDGRVVISTLDIDIAYGCNLRCESCNRLSPYRTGYAPTEQVLEWLNIWGKKIMPSAMVILGGEPLLHPDLEIIIRAVRNTWGLPARLYLTTNGFLINDVDIGVLNAVKEVNAVVNISRHFTDRDVDIKRLLQNKVAYRMSDYTQPSRWIRQYKLSSDKKINTPYTSDPAKAYNSCINKACPSLHDNRLYKCNVLQVIQKSVQEGVISAEDWKAAMDYIPLSPDADAQTILKHFCTREISACGICPEIREVMKHVQMPD